MAWVVILGVAKGLKLEKHGFELKIYSLVYKNQQVQSALTRVLGRTRRGIKIFANVSVVAGFLMMGFAFWFLLANIFNYFVAPIEF
ncbi:MAG: peptidase, partial [Nitrosopumilus sp. CG10_big_fil_rev_8_21_14_0_10_33_7]